MIFIILLKTKVLTGVCHMLIFRVDEFIVNSLGYMYQLF